MYAGDLIMHLTFFMHNIFHLVVSTEPAVRMQITEFHEFCLPSLVSNSIKLSYSSLAPGHCSEPAFQSVSTP